MSAVDEIKSRLDIVSYIQRTVPLKRAGRVYKACCPFHNERTPSFVVDPDRGTWRCYGACAEGGDLFNFVMKQNGWSFQEALEELAKQAGIELQPQTPEQRARVETLDRLRGMLKFAAEFYHERLLETGSQDAAATFAYARDKRGLSEATLIKFQIGYAPAGWRSLIDTMTEIGYSEDDLIEAGLAVRSEAGRTYDRFRHRLMIPIRDERGRVVGFGARALSPDENPKYLNSPQSAVFDKSRLLFGLDTAARHIRETGSVVIVEGYLDAIQAQQAGYGNVVAQMGTALTEAQLKLVAPRWASRIVLALDSDAAGQNATRRSLEVARAALEADYAGRLSVDLRVLSLPEAKDPDDLIRADPDRWAALVEQAMPVADYVIDLEVQGLPKNASLQEREAVARRLLPLLLASESELYRQDNVQKLAMKLRIAERDLLVWSQEQESGRKTSRPRRSVVEAGDVGSKAPAEPAAPADAATGASAREAPPEANCLRLLLKQPDLYYAANRTLRELAGDDAALVEGPLSPLTAQDFTRNAYREIMRVLEEALEQDEHEILDYVHDRLAPALYGDLALVLQDEYVLLEPHLRHGLRADLTICVKQSDRTRRVIEPSAFLIAEVLKLRRRRIDRALQEIAYLQADEGLSQNERRDYLFQAELCIKAKRLIDSELAQRTGALRRP